jgi:hypothetical protein
LGEGFLFFGIELGKQGCVAEVEGAAGFHGHGGKEEPLGNTSRWRRRWRPASATKSAAAGSNGVAAAEGSW